MALLNKRLHFSKGSIEQVANAYSTTDEAGSEYAALEIDGLNAYATIGNPESPNVTMGRVYKNGIKAVLSDKESVSGRFRFRTPGTYTFTVPAGVTSIKVEIAGAGGGGGTSTYVHYSGN